MAARASAKTELVFGLVSCPVALYLTSSVEKAPAWDKAGPNGGRVLSPAPAPSGDAELTAAVERSDPLSDDPREAFKQVATPMELADPIVGVEDGTGVQLTAADVRKGLRNEDEDFLDLTDGLEQIADATRLDEMRVADFIRTEEIRRERILGSYYVAPDGPGASKVLRLMYEAMVAERRCAVVKFTKRSKQSLAVLVPHAETKSVMVVELAWSADVREAPSACASTAEVEVSPGEVEVAVELVQAMRSTKSASLEAQTDDARRMTAELIEKAQAGEEFLVPERPTAPEGAEVIELMRTGVEDRDRLAAAAA